MTVLRAAPDVEPAGNVRSQMAALAVTAVSLVVLAAAYLAFPGFWPPMSPRMPIEEVAAFYRDNTAWIRLSMVTFNLCGVMLLPLFAVVVVQMKRMANQSQVFAYCYLSAAVSGATIFALAAVFFSAAAFRPDRDAESTLVLNDLGWIVFIAPIGMVLVQNVMLALAIYHDDASRPVLPRWLGHLSIVVAVAVAPAAVSVAVDSGPFAWDGLLSFWLRNVAIGAFLVTLLIVLARTVRRQALAEGSTP